MSTILRELRPGDRFHFHTDGSRYVYEGRGWCHLDVPGAAHGALMVEVDQVVFRAEEGQ